MTVLLFPGQGAQFVGMGEALAEQSPEARAVFQAADDALGFSLSKLCWQGPEADLMRTEHAQPAILTHSIAALRAVQAQQPLQVRAVAGHSLGEWTALVAAGALGLEQAVRLVHLRGQLMQAAVPAGVGAMSAILGLDRPAIELACAEATLISEGGIVVCATHNDAANSVISGHVQAVARASELCLARGAMRALALPVSAPFHSPLMVPAAEQLAKALSSVRFGGLAWPLRSTVLDGYLPDTDCLYAVLVEQMTAAVLWQEAIEALAQSGATRALALGPAAAVPGLVKRTARGLKVTVVSEPADLAKWAAVQAELVGAVAGGSAFIRKDAATGPS